MNEGITELIGRRLRELRAASGLSLDALAHKSGVSRSNISLIERGQSSPTAVVLDKLSSALGVSVAFEPGARTAWHTHPLGQTLIVTAGCGLIQLWGGPVEAIHPGDVVWIAPGEKHWHGAAPNMGMVHLAIQEQQDGKTADFMEHVGADQYPSAPVRHARTR